MLSSPRTQSSRSGAVSEPLTPSLAAHVLVVVESQGGLSGRYGELVWRGTFGTVSIAGGLAVGSQLYIVLSSVDLFCNIPAPSQQCFVLVISKQEFVSKS